MLTHVDMKTQPSSDTNSLAKVIMLDSVDKGSISFYCKLYIFSLFSRSTMLFTYVITAHIYSLYSQFEVRNTSAIICIPTILIVSRFNIGCVCVLS